MFKLLRKYLVKGNSHKIICCAKMTDTVLSDLDRLVASVGAIPTMNASATAAAPPNPEPDPPVTDDLSMLLENPFVVPDAPESDLTEEQADTLQKMVVSYLGELETSVKKSQQENEYHCSLCVRDDM